MRRYLILVATLLVAAPARDGSAYKLIEYFNDQGQLRHLFWAADNQPVAWSFYNLPPDDFSLETAIAQTQAAFDTWEAVETADITFRFEGRTNAEPFVFFDSINTLGFITDESLRGTGILGATNFIVFTNTGEIAESDIFFNADAPWSANPNGTPGRFDYQATALHEIGHFIGLDHSGLGYMESRGARRLLVEESAIMFPFAFPPGTTIGRALTTDDVIGVSLIYPASGGARKGSVSGTVTKDGRGLEAAHVTLFNPFTEELIGVFTDQAGNYRVEGLSPGPIIMRVHPIVEPTSPSDFSFEDAFIDLDWSVTFREGRAEVTAGANTPNVDVEVMP